MSTLPLNAPPPRATLYPHPLSALCPLNKTPLSPVYAAQILSVQDHLLEWTTPLKKMDSSFLTIPSVS